MLKNNISTIFYDTTHYRFQSTEFLFKSLLQKKDVTSELGLWQIIKNPHLRVSVLIITLVWCVMFFALFSQLFYLRNLKICTSLFSLQTSLCTQKKLIYSVTPKPGRWDFVIIEKIHIKYQLLMVRFITVIHPPRYGEI